MDELYFVRLFSADGLSKLFLKEFSLDADLALCRLYFGLLTVFIYYEGDVVEKCIVICVR